MIFNILILDDEKIVCNSIKRILEDSEKSVFTANIVSEAEDILKNKSIDLLLLDYKLGEEDGISVLENIKDKFPDLTVIMITAYGNIDIAVKAMKLGVYDFIQKKEDPTFIRFTIQRTLDNLRLKKEVDNLKAAFNKNACMPRIIAVSKSMTEILELAREFAKSDSTVLIEGETGTGKNLLAEYIHFHSPRFDQAFIPINCAAIPAELIESELFGYEKGAFTGAHQQGKQGLIERANNGTLLLDEIGELSPKLQTKLSNYDIILMTIGY